MKRAVQIFLIFGFISLTMLPRLWELGFIHSEPEGGKKAFLTSKEFSSLRDLKTDYDEFYQENHGGADFFRRAYSYIQYNFFKSSPKPKSAILGEHDWWFLGNRFEKVLNKHQGVESFNPAQLQQSASKFQNQNSWAQSRGIHYYLAVAPNKHSVYNQYLPPFHQSSGPTKFDQLKRHFSQNKLEVIDLKEEYYNYKHLRLFHKTDSHWNDLGAFLGYQRLMRALSADFNVLEVLEFKEFTIDTTIRYDMDIAKMLQLELKEEVLKLKPKGAVMNSVLEPKKLEVPEDYEFNPYEYEIRYKGAGSLKILVFRDSFGENIIPFLKEGFRESVFIRKQQFNKELIAQEKPDIVVQIIGERAF